MLKIVFFAQVRELVATESLNLIANYATVADVRHALSLRGDKWALALEADNLLIAVNQVLVLPEHPVQSGDEIAFFPPVTGG